MESFVDTWASHGGNLSIVCTNTPDAPAAVEDPPPAQEGTLDFVPTIAQGEESNEAEEDGQIEGPATGPGPVAEGLELRGKTMAEQSPNHYADTVGRWWDLWFQDTAVNVEDDDSICDEDLEDILGMDGLVDELAIKALYNCNNAASEPGPVAEALDGLLEKATSMNFQGMLNSAKNSLKMPAGESYGLLGSLARSFMQEPELEVTDPFLADRAEYPGVPKYVNDVNVSRTTDETVEALIAKVGAADRNSLVPIEEQLEGTALRIRNMFWYNKALSPLEFPLKLGQWKRVEKSTFARMKALQKGKKRRRGKNDLPERPALQFSTALLLAVRIGRASMVRKLLEYRCVWHIGAFRS